MLRKLALGLVLLIFVGSSPHFSQAWADDGAAAPDAAAVDTADAPSADTPDGGDTPDDPPADPPAPFEWSAANDFTYTFNTIFMFICAILVIFMQAGFSMVEVGLNSQKNTVNILFKNLMDFCLGAILFLFVGYGLMYPGGDFEGKWFGFGGSMVTRDAQGYDAETGTWEAEPNHSVDEETGEIGAGYSSTADFMFQVAFAATAATIVSGAVAGRMKFTSYLVYSAIITAVVYPISGMWKWGGGVANAEGFQDFAGSIVVHAVGGFAGLAGALALGPRIGRFTADGKSKPIPGHNLTFAALGVFILLIGWYGFNPGSLLAYDGAVNAESTVYIALTTTLAAAAGANASMFFAWGLFKKPDLTMGLNGALAGLVGITANCDRVSEGESLIIGAVAGILVVLGIMLLEKLCIDDPVGAFPVHGICGVWGGIATGIFGDIPDDFNGSRPAFLIVQVKWTVIICLWAFATMAAVFYGMKAIGQLRVNEEEEMQGLDLSEHGMAAYAHS
ncbi:MAG: ammonium transporter [Planctomycetaceae bacterium]